MRKLSLDVAAYAYQIAVAADQMLNAALGGYADETLSSRIYRNNHFRQPPRRRWKWAMRAVDTLFFWQPSHCRGAYEREKRKNHFPPELRP